MNTNKRNKFHALCFYAFSLLWPSLTFSTALVEISFMVALISWMIWKFQEGVGKIFERISKNILFFFLGFVILSVLSFFWSEFPQNSFRGIFKVLQQAMIFLIAVDLFVNEEDFRFFERIFLFTLSVVIINSFWQYFTGKDFIRGFIGPDSRSGMRVTGSFSSYGILGSFLILTLPYLGALFVRSLRSNKKELFKILFYLLFFIGGFIVLFLTRSRGCFLAFFLGFFMFLILKKQIRILVYSCVLLAIGFVFAPWDIIMHFDVELKEQSLVERYYLWDRAINVIKAKPLTGTGINTYVDAHTRYDVTQNWRVRNYYAHNGYLQMAAETGLITLLMFAIFVCMILFSGIRRAYRSDDINYQGNLYMLSIGLINFLILALVDTVMHNLQAVMAFWYLLGYQLASQRRGNRLK